MTRWKQTGWTRAGRTKVLASIAVAACVAAAQAQAPGALDFGRIPGLENVQPAVEINLNPAMLGFVAEATRNTDPSTANLLTGLQGISVYVYEGIGDGLPAVLGFIDSASAALESDGWSRAVQVQDGGDRVLIYLRVTEPGPDRASSSISGLTLMVVDSGGDAVFVNVAGSVDPAQLGRIVGAFGIDGVLDGLSGLGGPGGFGGPGAPGDPGDPGSSAPAD